MNTIKKAAKLFNLFYIDLQGNVDYSDLSLEEAKEQIQIVVDNYLDEIDIDLIHYKDKSYRDVDQIRCLDILTTCLSATNSDFNDLSVDELAEMCNMSSRSLSRHFKEVTDKTIVQKITDLRIAYACERMKETRQITFSAFDAGFNDISFFYRVFKKYKGMTPKEFISRLA